MSTSKYDRYEMVIGLEVHVELRTKTKIFCSCRTAFGGAPNTQTCPVCLGYPGTLPVLNRAVVDYAIKAGLATNCKIARYSKQDRKNYFYPDLPKAYQISQYDLPLCYEGGIQIETSGGSKTVRLTRIHIEEDAGKLMHEEGVGTLIDGNRCGVPLIEIVSEPDMRSAEEAVAYVKKLRAIMLYIGVSDCKMQEGSLRCDVNLSVRPIGEEKLGTRTEIKNLNSFSFIMKAIDFEFRRQVDEIEAGHAIVQETRRFDTSSGKTFAMRSKEDADDYRYFPDPDLAPIITDDAHLASLAREIPELPDARKKKYVEKFALTPYDAELITAEKRFADFFDAVSAISEYPKIAANLICGELFRYQIDEDAQLPMSPAHFASLADMIGRGEINGSTAKRVLSETWQSDADPVAYVRDNDLCQINDEGEIEKLLREAVAENPRAIESYKAGKVAAVKSYVGAVMAKSGGRANPVVTGKILDKIVAELTK